MTLYSAIRIGLVIVLACPLGRLALADTYKWVDKKGVIHFTDNPDELPEPQRSQVLRKLEEQEKEEKKSTSTQQDYEPISPDVRKHRLPVDIPPSTSSSQNGQVINPDIGTDITPALGKKNNKADPLSKAQRKTWKEKAARARASVSKLEKQCMAMKRDRDKSARKSLIFATPNARRAAASTTEELNTCEQHLEKARQYLNRGLPEEARRAGVPPGWIR